MDHENLYAQFRGSDVNQLYPLTQSLLGLFELKKKTTNRPKQCPTFFEGFITSPKWQMTLRQKNMWQTANPKIDYTHYPDRGQYQLYTPRHGMIVNIPESWLGQMGCLLFRHAPPKRAGTNRWGRAGSTRGLHHGQTLCMFWICIHTLKKHHMNKTQHRYKHKHTYTYICVVVYTSMHLRKKQHMPKYRSDIK